MNDMKKLFVPDAVVAAAMFAYAPFMILDAPYESTMGLVQKIFYFHAACRHDDVPRGVRERVSAARCSCSRGSRGRDRMAVAGAELTVMLGMIVLVTGPLWARKAWGVWWEWDPRLTSTLVMWLIFNAYLLLRRYGGPGSDRLAAAVALFGMANVPFVLLVGERLADAAPEDLGCSLAAAGHARPVLVLRARVPAGSPCPARRAHGAGEAAAGARRAVSGVPRTRMMTIKT